MNLTDEVYHSPPSNRSLNADKMVFQKNENNDDDDDDSTCASTVKPSSVSAAKNKKTVRFQEALNELHDIIKVREHRIRCMYYTSRVLAWVFVCALVFIGIALVSYFLL